MADMVAQTDITTRRSTASHPAVHSATSHVSLDANIIIANAPDPVFGSDLEGKILLTNDAVSQLLGFRTDELIEQSLSRIISPEETKAFLAALREVVEREKSTGPEEQPAAAMRTDQRGVTRN